MGVDERERGLGDRVDLIRRALAISGGNKNRAAELLGVDRATLVEMIRRTHAAP